MNPSPAEVHATVQPASSPDAPVVSVEDLRTYFDTPEGIVRAVDGVRFQVPRGKVFGLVGESGCGKSVTALSILRVLPPNARIVSGQIRFDHGDLCRLPEAALQRIRGNRIAMIFQEPLTSLNPVFSIGYQIAEPLRIHQGLGRREAAAQVLDLLRAVRIPDPETRIREYPHQLSGGMRQRVMIAMAIATRPALLIADEPTTALDATIQAQILDLLAEIRATTGSALLLITHDLGIIAETADAVAIMYAGEIVEQAATLTLFTHPAHPYTQGLLASLPRHEGGDRPRRLQTIPGVVPKPINLPEGCRFAPRCSRCIDACTAAHPVVREVAPGHLVRCIRA